MLKNSFSFFFTTFHMMFVRKMIRPYITSWNWIK